MKKYSTLLCAALLLFACEKQPELSVNNDPGVSGAQDGVAFVAGFTKVTTVDGVNGWDSGDKISIFSVANGADAGVSVGTNVAYQTADAGASASFTAVDLSVPASNKYYAFYPYLASYPSAYNPDTNLGFAGAAANADVTDYRFMPVFVNSNATVTFDPTTGESTSNSQNFFWAAADAPANEEDPVMLQFKPVLPLLQLDLYGYGSLTKVEIAFDKNTNPAGNENWLTAKGVFDLSTGAFTTTNLSNSAYCKLPITLKETEKDYIELKGDIPMSLKVTVGPFTVSDGLTLTFTLQDGSTLVKKIWEGTEVSTKTTDGKPKHLRQGIKVPYVKASVAAIDEFSSDGGPAAAFTVSTNTTWSVQSCPEWISLNCMSGVGGETVTATASANTGAARSGSIVLQTPEGARYSVAVSQAKVQIAAAGYYSVDLSAIDFSDSFIYDVVNADDKLIARITREYLGSTQDVQIRVAYPAPSQTPDYTAGLSLENGGEVDAWTMTPGSVTYTPGASSALTTIWVSDDGSQILTAQPSGSISAATVSPYRMSSPTGQLHALVKIGSQIWTAEGYKTTQLANGTSIAQQTAAPYATSGSASVIISGDMYLYNAHAVKANFAPTGWALPSVTQWVDDLGGFLGGTKMYANLGMDKAQLYPRNTWKLNGTALADLGYYNDWSCEVSSSKWTMLMVQNKTAPKTSAQNMTAMFEVRLIQQ